MQYEQIEAVLTEHKYHSTLASLRRAVKNESNALKELRADLDCDSCARKYFAEDVTRWLEQGGTLRPDDVLGHRPRYTESWAVAMMIREIQDQDAEANEADRKVRAVLRDMSWVLQTIHNAFHPSGIWRECSVGVCASADDIFSRAGFTKHLERLK